MKSSWGPRSSGVTLTELIVVVGIVGVLIALIFPTLSTIPAKADEIVCMSHLHELWIKFAPCATDPEGWPQLPPGVKPGTPEESQFWLDYSSNNLDVSPSTWLCPTIAKAVRRSPSGTQVPLIDYLPTLFDSRPGTPNRWPSMPWFSEIANVHGLGNLTVTANGAVQPSIPLGGGGGQQAGSGQ
jgi:hypothetical protein